MPIKPLEKDVENLGQVFTPDFVVSQMLVLKKKSGAVLEPSCGDGAFLKHLSGNFVGLEIDQRFKNKNVLNQDFFDYPTENKFDTIIGNPPYVRFNDISQETKGKLRSNLFDKRSNLYLFFIEKSIRHLNPDGEIIFITPRDFLKATSSIKLNNFIYQNGTITDIIDLGDKKIFEGFSPNCIIWRFEKDNFSRKTNFHKNFIFSNGQLLFVDNFYPINFQDIFFVKVGAVSGADDIFAEPKNSNTEFVCSFTAATGKTKKMIYNKKIKHLEKFKPRLLNRKIKKFNENNWWTWGRDFFASELKRIYVNCKTRNKAPFFIHQSNFYDGSILAIFPHNQKINLRELTNDLNNVDWGELGFICDGRYIFSQKSLENCVLPENFRKYSGFKKTLL